MVKWLNPSYNRETLHKAAMEFTKDRNIQLMFFLSQKGLDEFKQLEFKHVYEPTKYSYEVAKAPNFVKTAEFCAIISTIVGRDVHVKSAECRLFDKSDYTILYDALEAGKGFVLMLDLVNWDEAWGGYTSFMKGNKEIFRIVPRGSALSIIDNSGLRMFTKYVNHHATHPRIFLYAVLQK